MRIAFEIGVRFTKDSCKMRTSVIDGHLARTYIVTKIFSFFFENSIHPLAPPWTVDGIMEDVILVLPLEGMTSLFFLD